MKTIICKTVKEIGALIKGGCLQVDCNLQIDCTVPWVDCGVTIDILNVLGHLDVQGDLNILGHLDVGGYLNVQGNLYVQGYLNVQGNLYVQGYFDVRGNLYAQGYLNVRGDLDVQGYLDIRGYLNVQGNLYVQGYLDVRDYLDIGGHLYVGGNWFWSHMSLPQVGGTMITHRVLPPEWQRKYWEGRLGLDTGTRCYNKIIAGLDIPKLLKLDKWTPTERWMLETLLPENERKEKR